MNGKIMLKISDLYKIKKLHFLILMLVLLKGVGRKLAHSFGL